MAYKHYDRATRDNQIHQLHAEGTSTRQIATIVGCHRATIHEILNPQKQTNYNQRRREHNTSPQGLQRQREYRARTRQPS